MLGNTHDVVPLIYSAIPNSHNWKTFLDAFAAKMRASVTNLFILTPSNPETSVTASRGPKATHEILGEWREKWADKDPWMSGKDLSVYGEGVVTCSEKLCPDDQLEPTEIYQKFLAKHGFHYGGGVLLASGAGQFAVQTLSRPKSVGVLTEEEVGWWQSLVPHLMQAIRLQSRLQEAETARETFEASFENDEVGLLLLNQLGVVLRSNREARRILAENDGLLLRTDQRLSCSDSALAGELADRVHHLGYPGEESRPASSQVLVVQRRDFRRPFLVTIVPLLHGGESSTGPQRPTVSIRIVDPEAGRVPDSSLLQKLFGLTEAEAQFCCRLASGLTVEEIAAASCVSLNTARTHLKRSLSKTGTKRQAELMVLLQRVSTQQS